MTMLADFFPQTSKIFTVGELTRAIRGTLETKFGAVWVQGEISNYKLHPSGHQYFTLKDQRAQIACVIWRDSMAPLRQPLADGAQVQVYGSVTVYETRGQYQLNVQILQPRGVGLLQAKFEALKRKLEAEGLFAEERKRPLPKFPRRIGIVTSPSGAAIRDMLNVLRRRAPWLQILINPVRVQGTGAAQEIAVAIRELALPNQAFAPVDLIVVTRGGGSIEDLWEFNEEIVARAIFHSAVPIVSAVGHEIDFAICDFVADLRAPTPSAAAEIVSETQEELCRKIDAIIKRGKQSLLLLIERKRSTLERLAANQAFASAEGRIESISQRLDQMTFRMERAWRGYRAQRLNLFDRLDSRLHRINLGRLLGEAAERLEMELRLLRQTGNQLMARKRREFETLAGTLNAVSPLPELQRGYAVVRKENRLIVKSVRDDHIGVDVRVQLH